MRHAATIALVILGLGLGGCSSTLYTSLPYGQPASAKFPPIDKTAPPQSYLISPGDQLSLSVFGEPEISGEKILVDEAGNIQVPLIGQVQIMNLSPSEASTLIANRLGARYLRDPKVTVNVTTQNAQEVSIEGQVTKAGVYPVSNDTTLLSAIALAQSPTRIAKLDEIVIFRTIGGERTAARFNLERVRAGVDPDPRILGGDVVVVGFSQGKSIYRDIIAAAPLFNIFTRF